MAENYLTDNPALTIDKTVRELNPDKVLVVTDSNVKSKVLPLLSKSETIKNNPHVAIVPGESGKNLESVTIIWDTLEKIGATRRSLIINIGGGVVTDLGGFAAGTFKRGIRTINFPTTLLGAVDAATGGKTGINFEGLKNEIGVFHLPYKVIISAEPFSTLSYEEIMSGYAEMIKTAFISDRKFYISLLEPLTVLKAPQLLGKAVEKCVQIKDKVVGEDPHEKGLRKILNFGHTAGHAFESLRIEKNKPVTHGKAVAHGMMVALILSHLKLNFDSSELNHYKHFLKDYYGSALMECEDLSKVIQKMSSDKKNNKYGEPAFTLLKEIGVPQINCISTQKEITEALELYIDMVS